MNHSIYSADRATHLKVVVVALLMATAVAGLGVSFHLSRMLAVATTAVVKAGKPMAVSGSTAVIIR